MFKLYYDIVFTGYVVTSVKPGNGVVKLRQPVTIHGSLPTIDTCT